MQRVAPLEAHARCTTLDRCPPGPTTVPRKKSPQEACVRFLWPDFSPDGRWLAYVSDETGAQEVHVRPFPDGAPVARVSPNGGFQPVWSPDGQQLFYTGREPGNSGLAVMVVDVETEPAFRPGQPRMLFEGPYGRTIPIRSFDISPTGDRFVLREQLDPEPQPVTPINVVQHWFQELTERVPID